MGRPTIQTNTDADRDRWSRQISFPTLVWKFFNQLQLSNEVVTVATEMCLAHNIMIRNLNAIYLQCEQVTKPEDVTDFIRFCQVVLEAIHTHHDHEEQLFFPLVAE